MVGRRFLPASVQPRMDTKTEPRITLMTRIHKMPKTKLRMTKDRFARFMRYRCRARLGRERFRSNRSAGKSAVIFICVYSCSFVVNLASLFSPRFGDANVAAQGNQPNW